MISKSIWSDYVIENNYDKLNNDMKVDILIIGGGITGINVLYKLKNKNICLVERNKIAKGVTLNTTGKLTYLQDNLYKIIKEYNIDTASLYLKSQIKSMEEIKKIIEENHIDCDLEQSNSYIYINNKNNLDKIYKIKELLIKNNIKFEENNLPLIDYKYSINVNDTYLFNPIKYINGLLNVIDKNKIYENTNIIDIKYKNNKYICKTENNKIIANTVILATHYPYFIYPYFFPLKSYVEKSYMVSFRGKNDNVSIISLDKSIISIRNYKDSIIYLSNSHNICCRVDDQNNFNNLIRKIKNKPEYIWSNTDIITNDHLPYIGYIKNNLIISTGYNTWGMSNSVLSGIVIRDIIDKEDNKYIELLNPRRNKNKLRIIRDSLSTIKGYYEGFKNKSQNIKYSKINGIDVIIYCDKNKQYIVKRKCPHAKCNLIFNEIEKTFDCPCHSSRFDLDGNAIKGPSKYNIKLK